MALVVLVAQQAFLDFGFGADELLPALAQIFIGALTYLGVTGLLWWVQNFPPGPERELINGLAAVRRKLIGHSEGWSFQRDRLE